MTWQRAYLGVSTIADGSPEHGLAALTTRDAAMVAPLAAELGSADRVVRAKSLATELAKIAQALEELELGA